MEREDPPDLGAEVIQLRPRVPMDQGLTVVHGSKYCGHRAVGLDDKLRSVYCRSCKAPLDAFDALLYFARSWDTFREDKERCERDIKAAQSRLDLLERNERNARARARRIFNDVPDKGDMDRQLGGRLYAWERDGRIVLGMNQLDMTAAQARDVARQLLKLARQSEKHSTPEDKTDGS